VYYARSQICITRSFNKLGAQLCRELVPFAVAMPANVSAAQRTGMFVVEIGERLTVPSVDPDRQDQLIGRTATQDLELANHEAVVQCFIREGRP